MFTKSISHCEVEFQEKFPNIENFISFWNARQSTFQYLKTVFCHFYDRLSSSVHSLCRHVKTETVTSMTDSYVISHWLDRICRRNQCRRYSIGGGGKGQGSGRGGYWEGRWTSSFWQFVDRWTIAILNCKMSLSRRL